MASKAASAVSNQAPEAKWWGQSLTIWGVLVTALSTVVPALGPLIGLEIPAEVVQQLGDHAIQVIQGIGGLIGTVMAVYGRARANAGLERRVVKVRL